MVNVTGDMSSKGMRIISQKTTKTAALGHKNMRIADIAQIKMPIDIYNKLAKSTKHSSKRMELQRL